MQSFGLNYEVKPEHTEEFKKIMADLIAVMEKIEGHVETKVFSDVAQPDSMMIYSNWKTKAQFAGFVRSETFQTAMSNAVALLDSKPTHFAGENIRLIKPAE